jgi:hypothetical protein
VFYKGTGIGYMHAPHLNASAVDYLNEVDDKRERCR